VFGRLKRLLPAVIIGIVVLSAPTAAFACNGGPSAENVYKECLPTGSGNKPTQQGSGPQKPLQVSPQTANALKHAGKYSRQLSHLVKTPGLSVGHLTPGSNADSATEPSALGSAFDLGSGPLALLAALGGTALLLLGGSGLRVWRRRQTSS
jgi:hypothetical protein